MKLAFSLIYSILLGANLGCIGYDLVSNNYGFWTLLNVVAALLCWIRLTQLDKGPIGSTNIND